MVKKRIPKTQKTTLLSHNSIKLLTWTLFGVIFWNMQSISIQDIEEVLPRKQLTMNEKTKIIIVTETRAGGDFIAQLFNKNPYAMYFHEPFNIVIKRTGDQFLGGEFLGGDELNPGMHMITDFFRLCKYSSPRVLITPDIKYQGSRYKGVRKKKNAQVINEREIIFYIKDYKINKNDGVYFGIFL